MNYIERYIYAVKKHLPAKQKEEVAADIRSLISEQVSEDDGFEKIEKVLKSLGSPKKLAYQYRKQDRYLIGPDHFELYFDVLKVALGIFVGINILLEVLSGLTVLFTEGPSLGRFMDVIFSDLIGSSITAALITFAVVTIGFAAALHFNWLDENDEWMLKELPELPNKATQEGFSFRSTLFETIGVSVGMFLVIFILRFPWIAFSEGDTNVDIQIITPANYETYFPLFLTLLGLYVFNQLIIMKQKGLTVVTVVFRSFHSLTLLIILFMAFFLEPVFLSSEDINSLASILSVEVSRLDQQINLILAVLLGLLLADQVWNRYKDVKSLKKA